jgi:hypothetical protein
MRLKLIPLAGLMGASIVFGIFGSADAAVIASTNFNGRVLSPSNTATNLNWTTNGVANPGNMAALNAVSAPQALFDTTALTQNNFSPALNTGNNNTFWTTSVGLSVLMGYSVSVQSVAFDYWAISAAAVQNVTRRSDFTVDLLSPAAAVLGTASIDEVSNGASPGLGTPVLLTFASPIVLSLPGTYSLRIKGGDYSGIDETGNHTGIDNLAINGTVSIPEPSRAMLAVAGLAIIATRRRQLR